MTSIKPIIRKNLIYAWRSKVTTLFSLFYPCIFLGIFISITNNDNNNISRPEQTYYNFITNFNMNDDYNYEVIPSISQDDSYAIIGESQELSVEIKNYIVVTKDICRRNCAVRVFKNEEDFEKYIERPEYKNETYFLSNIIQYKNSSEGQLEFKVSSIRFKYTSTWSNLNEFNIIPDDAKLNIKNAFFEYEHLMMSLLIFRRNQHNLKTNKNFSLNTSSNQNNSYSTNVQYTTFPMKSPYLVSVTADTDVFNQTIPVMLSISYISILFKFVLWMVVEKEKKLKDLLSRQGVSSFQYFLSWLLTFMIMTIMPIIVNSVLLNYYFFPNTNYLFIFFNLFLFSLNILAMALVFHQFVDNIRSGQSLLKLLYLGMSVLSVVVSREEVNIIVKYIFSIFPQITLKNSFEIFLQTKNFNNGMDLHMLFANFKNLSMFKIYVMYMINFILLTFFAFFIQAYHRSSMTLIEFICSWFRKSSTKRIKEINLKLQKKEDKCKNF